MPNISLIDIHQNILDYLEKVFLTRESACGWGLIEGKNPSITNTAEAILTYKYLGSLNCAFLLEKKGSIINYLKENLKKKLISDTARTRDIAYAAIALNTLEDKELNEKIVKKLKQMSRNYGWPEEEGDDTKKTSLIPTYHAIRALHEMGEKIDPKYYDWFKSLLKSNNLYSFSIDEEEGNWAASCLVLYLISLNSSKISCKMTGALKEYLDPIFHQMEYYSKFEQNKKESWVIEDKKNTGFKTFAYGHGLIALHRFSINLSEMNLSALISSSCESNDGDFPFALDSKKVLIPELLEFSMALHAIILNFDPFKYFEPMKSEISKNMGKELEEEKNRIKKEFEKQKIRSIVLDELEKDIIRQRLEIKESFNYGISEMTKKTIDLSINEFHISNKDVTKEIIRNNSSYILDAIKKFLLENEKQQFEIKKMKRKIYMVSAVIIAILLVPLFFNFNNSNDPIFNGTRSWITYVCSFIVGLLSNYLINHLYKKKINSNLLTSNIE